MNPPQFINDEQWEDYLRYEFELAAYEASLEDTMVLDLGDENEEEEN